MQAKPLASLMLRLNSLEQRARYEISAAYLLERRKVRLRCPYADRR